MGWVVSVTLWPRFTPRERTPGTHWIGGWVGPWSGLDTEATGKILYPFRGSNPDRQVVQSVASHYTDWVPRLTILCCGLDSLVAQEGPVAVLYKVRSKLKLARLLLLASPRLSVRPHVANEELQNGFLLQLILKYLSKMFQCVTILVLIFI
jgi:hypothetical protein